MGKYKRKFGIYAAWNYELEVEDLNKMSERGWQLIKGGCFSNKFKKNPDIQYRYQLDFQPSIEDKGRYIETFREQGWEYVCSTFNGWHYFRKLYDATKPEEEYEIFTDVSSVKEMNNRWAIVGMVCLAFLFVYLMFYLVWMITKPKLTTLFGMIYLGVIFAVMLRGVLVMRKSDSSKKSRLDKWLMPFFFVWGILGGIINFSLVEARPYCSWSNWSAEYSQISADLDEATNWLPIQVKYPDNYYLDLKIDASSPLRVSFVDEDRNVLYTAKSSEFEEENIRLWLEKGNYSLYFSDFEGGSVYVDMSFE
ncbi:MAG: DUF2812 domain-containing protein [Lachnospiraceae bacterium]|nr:DUF2812 domain-containing protein [Lachnospiraceae bacterium]